MKTTVTLPFRQVSSRSFTTKSPWLSQSLASGTNSDHQHEEMKTPVTLPCHRVSSLSFTTKSPWSSQSFSSVTYSRSKENISYSSARFMKNNCSNESDSTQQIVGQFREQQQNQERRPHPQTEEASMPNRSTRELYIPQHPLIEATEVVQSRKRARIRTQRMYGITTGAIGTVLLGPLGIVAGVATHHIVRARLIRREQQWINQYHQQLQEVQMMELYIRHEIVNRELVAA